jgi:hypothetical protein
MTASTDARRARVASIADAVVALLLLAWLWLLLIGAFRGVVGGAPLTVRWWHALVAAAVIAGLRHALVPSPSMPIVVSNWTAWISARRALADALVAFVVTRPTVLLVGLVAVATIGFPAGVEEPGTGRSTIAALAARFDANWYAGIAAEGYDWQGRFDRQQNLAFFPALPLLERALGALTGGLDPHLARDTRLMRLAACGLAISLAAFLGAAWYFARLAEDLLGDPRSRGALLLLASYPFAVFYSAAYTESLFLLAALGCWHSMRRNRVAAASVWGLVAGLARPNGFFLSVPLGLIALGARDGSAAPEPAVRSTVARRLAIAATPIVGMLIFTVYVYSRTGIWFAWARLHAAWGRVLTGEAPALFGGTSGDGLLNVLVEHPYDTLNALAVVFTFAMAWPVARTLGAFILVNIVPPLFAGGVLSLGRLSATLFPLFLALGALLPIRTMPAVIAVFSILQGLVAVLFYTWRSLY